MVAGCGGEADGDRPGLAPGDPAGGAGRILHQQQQPSRVAEQRITGGRQLHATAATLEQGGAQLVFQ
jgi:hypothetical protein